MSQTVTNGGQSQQAQEKVQEVAGQAREKVQEGQGGGLRGQVDQRSTQAGRAGQPAVRGLPRRSRESLQGAGQGGAGEARRAGGRPRAARRKLARALRRRPDHRRRRGLRAAQSVGRRAGGLALGFAASPRAQGVQLASATRAQRRRLPALRAGRPAGRPPAPTHRRRYERPAQRRPAPAPPAGAREAADDHAAGHRTGLREQSVGDLLKQLSQETSTLVRQEIDARQGRDGREGQARPAGRRHARRRRRPRRSSPRAR